MANKVTEKEKLKEKVVESYAKTDKSYAEIAKEYGISNTTVMNWVKQSGVSKGNYKIYTEEEKREAVRAQMSGATMKEIKEKYGVSYSSLYKWTCDLYWDVQKEMEETEKKGVAKEVNKLNAKNHKFVHIGSNAGYWK